MSQEQQPVRYGDVFHVQGELASKPVAPQDAATLQAAENIALGKIQKGGPATVMQSAADVNERCGVVHHDDITNIVRDEGATISEADAGGNRVVTEAIGGQVVGQYVQQGDVGATSIDRRDAITVGEALEATALSSGKKPIDESDAAAIQAAEIRATGLGHVVPGGVTAEAQSAAAYNARTMRDEDKTKLGDVLTDAALKLTSDKPVTREDVEGGDWGGD
ncbi:Seed maturation protein [Abeliophyllum distichum]|uniref:Seed maturation protein n=1 Tax=Abeliophyllum distichum TaxID=126358 RepID=A0ABD1VV90_9LAMI